MATASEARAYGALLAKFQAANPTAPALTSTDPAEIGEYLVANAPAGTAKTWLAELMAANAGAARRTGFGTWMLAGTGIVVAGAVLYGIFHSDVLSVLTEPASARGLVTFLFAFATIAVVLITVIATFWVEIDEVEKRGTFAKEVLAILIGIMGTILGFYFGSAPPAQGAEAPAVILAPD